ncbi:hypothetical protein B0J14DRAFT_198953 [Halenospora varia]|nr:hypothetical protein B0J14DRAFT_198953 [Halenospora varia]
MRIAGYQVRKPDHDNSRFHYSVYILRHLGIATYTKVFAAEASKKSTDKSSISSPTSTSAPSLSEVIRPIHSENTFEGEILEKWAKHILCAHINLKQARNADEVISKNINTEIYHQRLQGHLVESASYAADIPISAILSAFHSLSKNHAKQGEVQKPGLEEICEKLEVHTSEKSLNIFKQVSPWRQEQTAEFKFETVDPPPEHPEEHPELEVEMASDGSAPVLVFRRTFPLLVGRAHMLPELGGEARPGVGTRAKRLFFKDQSDEIRPCKKCAQIWHQE